jgi:hypothetical protein
MGGGTVFVPQPHFAVQYLDDQFSLGRVSQGLLAPGRRCLLLSHFRTSIAFASP